MDVTKLSRPLEPLVPELNVAYEVQFSGSCTQDVAPDAETFEQSLLQDIRKAIATDNRENVNFFKNQLVRLQNQQVCSLHILHLSP